MTSFSPREIVSELDRFIVGQNDAKRAVAIALRNRWRRQQLGDDLREEVLPKNILMIGPTGVGKTEIARRLARLAGAPFMKVEATKFTEVGYVGRDVESIIRDLVETGIHMTRERMRKEVVVKAEVASEERVLDALVGEGASADTRQKFRVMLRQGELDDREIEIDVQDAGSGMPTLEVPGMPGAQMGMINLNDMLGKAFGGEGIKSSDAAATQGKAVAALQDFQAQMQDLQALLHNKDMAEFCIVTIPTGLAIAESERLMLALEGEGIGVTRAVLNRLIDEEQAEQGEGGYV